MSMPEEYKGQQFLKEFGLPHLEQRPAPLAEPEKNPRYIALQGLKDVWGKDNYYDREFSVSAPYDGLESEDAAERVREEAYEIAREVIQELVDVETLVNEDQLGMVPTDDPREINDMIEESAEIVADRVRIDTKNGSQALVYER